MDWKPNAQTVLGPNPGSVVHSIREEPLHHLLPNSAFGFWGFYPLQNSFVKLGSRIKPSSNCVSTLLPSLSHEWPQHNKDCIFRINIYNTIDIKYQPLKKWQQLFHTSDVNYCVTYGIHIKWKHFEKWKIRQGKIKRYKNYHQIWSIWNNYN